MALFDIFKGQQQNDPQREAEERAGSAQIQVLLCAGRRVGKTSIMSAMQDNMDKLFPDGAVSVSIRQQSGDGGDPLDAFRSKQRSAFQDWVSPFYRAEESNQTGEEGNSTASDNTSFFVGEVLIKKGEGGEEQHKKVNTISFRDPRGEDFDDTVSESRKNQIRAWMRESQVIIIAIDTPRLMESDENGRAGAFHEAFNKPEEITDMIRMAWQGSKEERLILFVPLKCELYLHEGRGEEIVERVQEGYKSLLTYIRTSNQSALCSAAIVSCETMGGMEFRKFERLGGYTEGRKASAFRSVYGYRRYENGARRFQPRNCEQPLLYMLMFIFGMRKENRRSAGVFAALSGMPKYAELAQAHARIAKKSKRAIGDGYFILNDPQGFLNSRGTNA